MGVSRQFRRQPMNGIWIYIVAERATRPCLIGTSCSIFAPLIYAEIDVERSAHVRTDWTG